MMYVSSFEGTGAANVNPRKSNPSPPPASVFGCGYCWKIASTFGSGPPPQGQVLAQAVSVACKPGTVTLARSCWLESNFGLGATLKLPFDPTTQAGSPTSHGY